MTQSARISPICNFACGKVLVNAKGCAEMLSACALGKCIRQRDRSHYSGTTRCAADADSADVGFRWRASGRPLKNQYRLSGRGPGSRTGGLLREEASPGSLTGAGGVWAEGGGGSWFRMRCACFAPPQESDAPLIGRVGRYGDPNSAHRLLQVLTGRALTERSERRAANRRFAFAATVSLFAIVSGTWQNTVHHPHEVRGCSGQ